MVHIKLLPIKLHDSRSTALHVLVSLGVAELIRVYNTVKKYIHTQTIDMEGWP